jgi:hypothetical protein
MRPHILLLVFSISFLACSQKKQKQAEIEKEYIENLEEKNRILERELRELKEDKSFHDNDEPTKAAGVTESKGVGTRTPSKSSSSESAGYFTIGSTEEEVLNVMGDPSSISAFSTGTKIFSYELSTVRFENGRVKSYDNFGKNLKIRVRKQYRLIPNNCVVKVFRGYAVILVGNYLFNNCLNIQF